MGLENFLHGTITEQDTYTFTLCDILAFRAKETPDKAAFIFLIDGEIEEEIITYNDLYDLALRIAGTMSVRGIHSGERALMLFPPGLAFVKTLFACFYAGVFAVPAYPPRKNRSLNRIISIVNDCNPGICLTVNEIRDAFEKNFRDVDELRNLEWITTDAGSEKIAVTDNSIRVSPDDLALLQYTSGSTASPKGVMVSHRNLMRNMEFLRQAFELDAETKAVHWLPVFHDMGLIFGVLEAVYSGYTGILMPPVSFIQKPIRWLRAIAHYGAVLGGAPNFAYDLCVSKTTDEECDGLDLSTLRTLYNGAEPVRKETLDRFTAKFSAYGFQSENFYPTYGMAEATLILAGGKVRENPTYIYVDKEALKMNRIEIVDQMDEKACCQVSVGRPWIDTTEIIVDPETFQRCSEGIIGEIWVSGSIVALGYWNNIKATAESFHAYTKDTGEGPFLRTGDLGFYYRSELYVTGRIKDLIIIFGRNYYPQDIEYLVESSHPAIRPGASAAFSVEADGEEKLVIIAEVERTAIRDLDVTAVCDAIRQCIAEELELEVYAIQLLRTASILKTSSGKIQRMACKQGFLDKILDVVGESVLGEVSPVEEAPEGLDDLVSLQVWLLAWIHTTLNIPIERIDPGKPISVYGLNSMKAVLLQHDFLQKYGINFPPYLFFEKITIRDLAEKAYRLVKEGE